MSSHVGGLLLGNGDGTFGAPILVDTGGHAPATDLGDLDGDGDLDWVLSGFGGGLWKLYVNDGVPLAMPNPGALAGPVDVQLHRSGGAPCFGSTFSVPFLKSDGATFKDRAD